MLRTKNQKTKEIVLIKKDKKLSESFADDIKVLLGIQKTVEKILFKFDKRK